MKEYYEAMKQVFDVLMKEIIHTKMLGQSSFISNQVEPSNKSDCILSFLGNGSKDYMKVCEEHFPKKEKNFDDTIKRITVPQFFQKVGKL